jgi:hypothetical protein
MQAGSPHHQRFPGQAKAGTLPRDFGKIPAENAVDDRITTMIDLQKLEVAKFGSGGAAGNVSGIQIPSRPDRGGEAVEKAAGDHLLYFFLNLGGPGIFLILNSLIQVKRTARERIEETPVSRARD